MAVNDSCRLCFENLRIDGTITNSKLLFDKKEGNVASQLSKLGLIVKDTPQRSFRVCRKCCSVVSRLLQDNSKLQKWHDQETAEVLQPQTDEAASASADKRDREPTPSKTPRQLKKARTSAELPPPARTSATEVVINYSSRKVKVRCQDDVAGIVENLAKRNFRTAANLIAQNSEVMEEVQDRVLEEVEVECRTLCNQQNHFMLWRATATDLQSFSFHDLHADLKRLSPFLFSVLSKISKDSLPHICAAASIALRGRENRLSALAYYINAVLLYGGAKKAAFQRLSKLGICTNHDNAVAKERELAQRCESPVKSLKMDLESFLIQRNIQRGLPSSGATAHAITTSSDTTTTNTSPVTAIIPATSASSATTTNTSTGTTASAEGNAQ